MAALDAKDPRWIVAERADGTNVNSWHWTSKDVTLLTKAALAKVLEGNDPPVLAAHSPLLKHCRLNTVVSRGECSVNTRKGRKFLIYELGLKAKWEGEKRDDAGALLETASGELEVSDISAETLDALEVTFTTSERGSSLSEAMRKEGVAAFKSAIQKCIGILQAQIAKDGQGPGSAMPSAALNAVTAAGGAQPIKLEGGATDKELAPTSGYAADAAASAAAAANNLPFVMRMWVAKVKATQKGHLSDATLAAISMQDQHIPALIELLHSSTVELQTLDVTFNEVRLAYLLLRNPTSYSGVLPPTTDSC